MNNEPIDIISAVVALFVLVTGQEVAKIVGPYAAIVIIASSGAALSLSGHKEKMTFSEGAWYVGTRIMVAVAVTAALAAGLEHVLGWAKAKYTVVPIAFVIGFIRDYEQVRSWGVAMIDRFVKKRIDDGK